MGKDFFKFKNIKLTGDKLIFNGIVDSWLMGPLKVALEFSGGPSDFLSIEPIAFVRMGRVPPFWIISTRILGKS